MNVPKIDLNVKHIKWCQNFMKEQAKMAQMTRRVLKESRKFNPFDTNRDIDNILKQHEKSFW